MVNSFQYFLFMRLFLFHLSSPIWQKGLLNVFIIYLNYDTLCCICGTKGKSSSGKLVYLLKLILIIKGKLVFIENARTAGGKNYSMFSPYFRILRNFTNLNKNKLQQRNSSKKLKSLVQVLPRSMWICLIFNSNLRDRTLRSSE